MAGSDFRAIARNTEQLALDHLGRNGLRLLQRNFRCRHGEIDLIMLDRAVIVFVEVRFRKRSGFASAAASVDSRKQGKLCRAAGQYLRRHPQYQNTAVRFDVVAFDGPTQQDFKLQWLQDAFRPISREN
ncbi:MAG: YraN family protein [Gammaproteobacteria bacterium]|nr:YraN family protein [Gammaproteobacteria bacterium]MDH4315163.1 YraN family protein [Gammaproteobacteria bacterium]MDH5213616.1 YraN family protein [Gammaproteobacteria bacterium]MDH5500398.1 YraN family protein [Gammaproteobacteria bacterium]